MQQINTAAYDRGYDDGYNGRSYDHRRDHELSWQHQGTAGIGHAGSDYDHGYSQGMRARQDHGAE